MANAEAKDGCIAKTSKGCLGFFMGPALLLGAIYMLFWNEGEYIKIAGAINEAESQVQRVTDTNTPDSSLEGKLVYMRGLASTSDVLRDETYGIEANAIVMKRFVQFAQWKEEKKKRTGAEKKPIGMTEHEFNRNRDNEYVYHYKRTWVNTPINSAVFYDTRYREANQVFYQEKNTELRAQNVLLGGYTLNAGQIARIGGKRDAVIPKQIPPIVQGRSTIHGEYLHVGRAPEGNLYYQVNPLDPSIGDVRISWEANKPTQPVTLIAVQRGNSFEPYTAENGATIDLLYTDILNPAQCFEKARNTNTAQVWGVRFGGWLMMWGGFACMLSPLAKMVPLCRKLAEAGAAVISLLMGTILSLLTVAIAQLFFNPISALCLLLPVGGLIWLIKWQNRKSPAKAFETQKRKHINNQLQA